MPASTHYAVIGSGSAGFGAVTTLRERDPDCRISLITLSSLPFYNRYDLPRVFEGCHDWRELLPNAPDLYNKLGIQLRRNSRVVDVDGRNQTIAFAHRELLHYDRLLVCSGGRSYLPEKLSDYAHLMHGFASFEAAITVQRALSESGTAIILGGDMIGLDLAYTLLDTGHKVILVPNPQSFWPHQLAEGERETLLDALTRSGVDVRDGAMPIAVEEETNGRVRRRLVLEDGGTIAGDVVMAFCGLVPSVEFMLGAAIDIERGLLVTPELLTTNESIWAAGDVCQIWSDEEKEYKFYHGWKNVRLMGELAARNMTGAHEIFVPGDEESITIDKRGRLQSPFWDH